MKQKTKLFALCAGLFFALPTASALDNSVMQVTFKYDQSASVQKTYRAAEHTARKACGLNGRVSPMKRALVRSCVRPLVEDFVIATGDDELMAYHEQRTGRTVSETQFVAN